MFTPFAAIAGLPDRPKTGKPPEDLEQEIKILMDGIKATLQEAGMSMDDLVFVQVFCPDLSLYEKFNSTYRSFFGKEFPALGNVCSHSPPITCRASLRWR